MEKKELVVINEQDVLGKEFRIYGDFDNPLFLAKDVAMWIEHSDVSTMMRNVDEDEKVTNNICTLGGVQNAWFLTENGLYEVLMQSRKPIAKQFKSEVKRILKTLRKTGGYISNSDLMVNIYFGSLDENYKMIVKGLFSQIENQQRQLEESKPLVMFAETCLKSKDNILIRELAKIANDEGIKIGQNRLYDKLREWKMIMAKPSTEPYQTAMNGGYFVVEEKSIETAYGNRLVSTTKVTPKGQVYIIEKLKKEFINN
jgi:anti-repressor protein